MGSCISTIKSLQILKVSEGSVSHKNGVLPFIHSIISFNGKPIESKDDALAMNKEWESKALQLELIDMRTMETSILEIPRKDKMRLGISVKFHQSAACLLSMEVLRVNPGSPAEKAGMVVGDYILGIENIYSKDEDDLLRFLELNRRRTVPLLVYNNDLEYVRVVPLQVGMDVLLGCQIGMGELYKVPFNSKRGKIEFNNEIIRNDVRRLRRKLRGKDIISSRLRDVMSGSDGCSESMSSACWDVQEKTPTYDFMSSQLKEPLHDEVSRRSVQDLGMPFEDVKDVSNIPVVLPSSFTYEASTDRRVEAKKNGVPRDIVSILEQEQDDQFDFENSLSLVSRNEVLENEAFREPSIMGKIEVKEGLGYMHNAEGKNDEGSEAFLLPIEKSDSHKDEFDARNFLSSLSLSFYGTENGYDSAGSHKTTATSEHKVDDKCPLCLENHQEEYSESLEPSEEYNTVASKIPTSSGLEVSHDTEAEEYRRGGEDLGGISLDVFNNLSDERKGNMLLEQLKSVEDLRGVRSHSEEDSLETEIIGSPPYSDPGSIL
ncbi:hypothetical protein PFJ87_01g00480 [Encephalitozoon hellem]|uniref:PDZ domain-containing protein n=1 Tax=Encephalitozoon hellem TaxID=27973 RepID=A0ABY8CKH9_ENCHE|nr:hypothetical protein PFJ87_01g00480 [Encephalitozoon hellem]